VTDPEGYPLNVTWGQEQMQLESTFSPQNVVFNYPKEKPRIRQFNRFQPGPAAVYKVRFLYSLSAIHGLIDVQVGPFRAVHPEVR
jgi:hypothetical protein